MAWVSTAQSEHSDARMIQEDFAADESMRPQAIDRPGAAEELHPALFVGAAEVDHTAGGWALEVQIPVLRKRSFGAGACSIRAACLTQTALTKRLERRVRADRFG